jgi:glucose-6-phosphate isomerase
MAEVYRLQNRKYSIHGDILSRPVPDSLLSLVSVRRFLEPACQRDTRMQLPDESIAYHYQGMLISLAVEWGPAAELRARNLLDPNRLRALTPQLLQVRSQVAADRELKEVPPESRPLEAGFIDLPQTILDAYRRRGELSELGRILASAARLRSQVDRVVILGVGGSCLGAQALFQALRSAYHNELNSDARLGAPRLYFEGDGLDNDTFQDLIELLQTTCVDPEIREERWGAVVVSKSGATLETSVALRLLRREAQDYYGSSPERWGPNFVPVTGASGRLRDLCTADGFKESDVLTLPEGIGGAYSVFTAAGLLPAAIMGLDVRALLLGAAAMTRRFIEEPFERNPVLQYAGVNYLLGASEGKAVRVLAIWSKKLEALGRWYDQLLATSLGKQGRGPTSISSVHPRELHSRGQQFREGPRDKVINNLVVRTPRASPIQLGMAERNEDDLNVFARKSLPDFTDGALRGTCRAYSDGARPTANLFVPSLSEHALGQLMQLFMLATVVEGRLMGINPYGQPGVDAYKRDLRSYLRD